MKKKDYGSTNQPTNKTGGLKYDYMKEPRILPKDYYKKDQEQLDLQKMIDDHYAVPEKYEIVESRINTL